MATFRFYWPDCKGDCGRPIGDIFGATDVMTYCPECRGVNVFRNSTEPVVFLPLLDCRDAALLGHCTDSEKERLSSLVEWVESGCPTQQPLRRADYNSHSEKQPDTQTASLLSSTCENYSASCVPTSSA